VVRLEADFGTIVRIPLSDREARTAARTAQEVLVAAIEQGDAGAARRCARAHLEDTLDRVARTQADVHDRRRSTRSA
jgi:DNA-binding FadR family transcriptional regulator